MHDEKNKMIWFGDTSLPSSQLATELPMMTAKHIERAAFEEMHLHIGMIKKEIQCSNVRDRVKYIFHFINIIAQGHTQ